MEDAFVSVFYFFFFVFRLRGMQAGSPTRDLTQSSTVKAPYPNHEATKELLCVCLLSFNTF